MTERILQFADSKQYLGKIARSGENGTRSLAFDCSTALEEYPAAQIIAVIQRPQGEPYTVTPDADGMIRRITLTSYDLGFNGHLQIELRVLDGDKVLKSAIYNATVDDSIRGEADAPGQPVRDVLDRLDGEIKKAQAVVDDIRQKLENGEFNGSDAEVTAANIEAALGYAPVKDVQVAGSSVLDGGVAKVPMSGVDVFGTVKFGTSQNTGFLVNNGVPYISYATDAEISGRTGQRKTIVCANLDYAVKAAMCDGKGAAWTAAEQEVARERIGVTDFVTESNVESPAYTNQLPISTDASGAIFNGTGYQNNSEIDMSGAVVSGSLCVSGFIPVQKGDVIRIKDPSLTTFPTSYVFALYKADKATGTNIGRYINTIQANALYGTISISGNTLTWDTSGVAYYFWNDFTYARLSMNSSDSIITVNEEIVNTTKVIKTLKPDIKVTRENLDFNLDDDSSAVKKKIVVFGDSIIGMTRDSTSVTAYAGAYAGADVINVGFGGCRMSMHPTSGYAAFSMWALADAAASGVYTTQDAQASSGADYFPEQLSTLKSIDFGSVDAIVIHYGTNDFAANVAIDDVADDDSTSTVCGALRYSLRKILTAYPKIKIYISVPIYRVINGTGSESYTNTIDKKLTDYNSAIKNVAAEYNLPVIDGYSQLGINAINDDAYSTDGTHLNDHGRCVFGKFIGKNLI